MPVHVWNWFHKDKIFTRADLVAASVQYGGFGDLWVCPICLGQYVAICAAVGLRLADHGFSWFGAVIGVLSWTGVAGRLSDALPAGVAIETSPAAPIPAIEPVETGMESGEEVVRRLQAEQAGRTGNLRPSPLWSALVAALHDPPKTNPDAVAVSEAYMAERYVKEKEVGKACPACMTGGIIRKYMARMYDAGIRG